MRGPRLLPDVVLAQLPGREQRAGQQVAAVVQVALREPGAARGVAHVLPGQVLGQQRIAGDLAVVVHAKARVVAAKLAQSRRRPSSSSQSLRSRSST